MVSIESFSFSSLAIFNWIYCFLLYNVIDYIVYIDVKICQHCETVDPKKEFAVLVLSYLICRIHFWHSSKDMQQF